MTNQYPREGWVEEVAAIQHDQWSSWMRYLFGKCFKPSNSEDVIIPAAYAKNLIRLVETPYDQLTEKEKGSDRVEAERYREFLHAHTTDTLKGFVEELKEKLNLAPTPNYSEPIMPDDFDLKKTVYAPINSAIIDQLLSHYLEGGKG